MATRNGGREELELRIASLNAMNAKLLDQIELVTDQRNQAMDSIVIANIELRRVQRQLKEKKP